MQSSQAITSKSQSKLEITSTTTREGSPSAGGVSSRSLGSSVSGDASRASTQTVGFSIMDKRNMFSITLDDADATPEKIEDPEYITLDERYTHAAFDTKQRRKSALLNAKSTIMGDGGAKVFATTINLDDIHIDHTLNTEEAILSTDIDLEIAPSAFYLPKERPIMSYPPDIYVELKETPTVFLFDLPSISFEKGTAEATAVEQENEYYSYITVGKGRNRKTIVEETQTKAAITQSRHTLATRPQKKNAISFASMWDMHDTYARLAEAVAKEEEDEMVMYQSAAPHLLRKKKKGKVVIPEAGSKTFEELAKTPQFLDAVMLTERVLAASAFCAQQKKFRGLVPVNPLSKDLVYIYSMKPLWTLEYQHTAGRPITCISFNPKNENILAVGHGKFGYAESFDGFVAIWCTKNPCKPERLYRFKDPLTAVAFSEMKPNWLACGFANGDVLILDVISYEIKIVAKSSRETNPCFEPVWSARWCTEKDGQFLMTTHQDGRINRFTSTKTHDFICTLMMRVTTVEGKLKGLELKKTCSKAEVPITRYPAALCMTWHSSIEHLYFVGTDEGFIHKCSTHYSNQHVAVFRAHAGPVYGIERSPFMSNVMVSCGADGAIRMWLKDVDEVIMTLPCPAAVYGVAFCPKNSTLLISVSGNVLSVWDLRRKTHIPCADYTFATNVVLTYVKFSSSGDNVFVGDSAGKIHTFHLEDTPIPPFYQKKLLDDAIRKSLCTRPQLLKQLEKLEKFQGRRSTS